MKLQHSLLLCGLVAFTGVTFQAQAQTPHKKQTNQVSSIDTQNAYKEPVVKLYQALNAIQKSSKSPIEQRISILDHALNESYDFPAVIAKTVGYRYNSFSPQEKEAVLTAFKKYTVSRYLSSFADETNTEFKINPDIKTTSTKDKLIVSTTIGSGSDATPINYIIHNTPQGWKIIDVLLNGNISQTAVQHGDFSSTLSKGGSQALVEMLNKKTQSFKNP